MNNSFKSFLMYIVAFISSMIVSSGLPQVSSEWVIMGITVGGTALAYFGNNWMFPSVSIWGSINLKDILSGVLISVSTGVFNWLGTLAAQVPFDFNALWVAVYSGAIGYLATVFASPNGKSA